MNFWVNVHLVEKVLNRNEHLKEHIYGVFNKDFVFDPVFMEGKCELNQHWSRQISRTERNDNIEFDSLWTLLWQIWEYCLGRAKDEREPLGDADKL